MGFRVALGLIAVGFASVLLRAQLPAQPPKIWDDSALADWATPIASLNVRPAHYSSAEYYAVPGDNLRTYPVYHPDDEPPGYWEELQKKNPEPLVDLSKIQTTAEWIAAGERAFHEIDTIWMRTNDPARIAQARDRRNFENVLKVAGCDPRFVACRSRPDGAVLSSRWVVTPQGVMLSTLDCARCHSFERLSFEATSAQPTATPGIGAGPPPGGFPPGVRAAFQGGSEPATLAWAIPRLFIGDNLPTAMWRHYTVPWAVDDRIEQLRNLVPQEMTQQQLQQLTQMGAGSGVIPRANGSPFHGAKVPDLRLLRYSRYIDATGTHRLRGPEDIARYAALVTGADRMDFGRHQILTDEQRRMRFRYADELLYAIGAYLLSLEPPKNPHSESRDLLSRGEEIFRREGCVNCHVPPAYTSGKLTLANGWELPADHPNRDDVVRVSVGTDPGLALKTRKGTGFYKIPSLRGVWYRANLLHDGSMASLDEMFDDARLAPDYEPKGWNPRFGAPAPPKRAVPGHTFGLSLTPDDKRALLAFLRSL